MVAHAMVTSSDFWEEVFGNVAGYDLGKYPDNSFPESFANFRKFQLRWMLGRSPLYCMKCSSSQTGIRLFASAP